MGRQANFFLSARDVAQFIAGVRDEDAFLVFPYASTTAHPSPIAPEWTDKPGEEGLSVYLLPEKLASKARYRENPQTGRFHFDIQQSPAVELARCYEDAKILRRGRLYFTVEYPATDGSLVKKPEAFISWGDRLLRKLRKMFPARHGLFILGPEAEQKARAGVSLETL